MANVSQDYTETQLTDKGKNSADPKKELDVGALFVLKSRGTSNVDSGSISVRICAQVIYLLYKGRWENGALPDCDHFRRPNAGFGTNAIFLLPLRHFNLSSLILSLAYCVCTTAGASILATIAPQTTGKMFKGLLLSYAVAISGYWAFGDQSQGNILQNFIVNGQPLVPKWFLAMTNILMLLQLIPGALTYLQPTNVVLERAFADPKKDEFSSRNVIPRIVFWSATLLAAMLPFFGDMLALLGAFACIPFDFILPMIFYNVTFKPSKKTIIFWGNTFIAFISTELSLVGAVASVRQIVLDAKTYRLFANV
ncbi:hypothetical protein RHMOL_Rhmol09G0204200 [Rhododendron molle]|uniref:Uncharacterized protein n=1 Tax=Rhododendron molle TaxID=49168 RepID=A0ACC0MHA6_RHOML|nr:hypothetical protein RHMOL_Rhmol09G0204200 [Rhododendron molle]